MMKEAHFQQFSSPWKYFLYVFVTSTEGCTEGDEHYEDGESWTCSDGRLQHLVRTSLRFTQH